MAAKSQGITVGLNGDFGELYNFEVVSLSIDGVQSDVVEITTRSNAAKIKQFRPADVDYGTISMVFRLRSFTDAAVGQTAYLGVSFAGTTFWDGPTIVQSFAWQATVGELQEYRATFNLGAVVI